MSKAASPASAAAGVPRRALAFLGVAVALAHWVVLEAAPPSFGLHAGAAAPATTLVFSTRRIEPKPAPASTAAVGARTPAPPAPKARPAKLAQASPAKSPPSPEHTEAQEPAQPAQSAQPEVPNLPDPPASAVAAAAPAEPVLSQPPAASPADAAPGTAPAEPSQVADSSAPIGPLVLPASIRLQYDMNGESRGLNYLASGTLTWRNDGQSYEAQMTVSAFLLGSRAMASAGLLTVDGLAPRRFADKSRRGERAAHFEADKRKIIFSANSPDAPWVRGAQDRLSVFLQLSGMLAGDPARFTEGSKVSIYTVGPRDADTWVFTVEGTETLSLPVGDTVAIKLSSAPRKEFDQKVEAWFAPLQGYLPVRIKLTQHNGDSLDQRLASTGAP